MPEGDTLYRVAARLRPLLIERRLERVELHLRRRPSLETRVTDVHAQGKHLLIELETREALRIHLGMWGSWHRYPIVERYREHFKKPASQASVLLECNGAALVCFHAKEVECLALRGPTHRVLGALGPDLLGASIDLDEVTTRARERVCGERPVVDLLLDQRVACGIGNVYKNEVLFLERIDPRMRWGELSREQILALFASARELMQRNLGLARRKTTPPPLVAPHWVYSRSGQPCLECETPIAHARFGAGRRDTYWCPSCQGTHSIGTTDGQQSGR